MDSSVSMWSLTRATLGVSMRSVDVGVLRLLRNDVDGPAELGREFGFEWPVEPNTMAGQDVRAAWLAPSEWAILGPPSEVAARVAKVCIGRLYHFADVSAGRSLWHIWGSASRNLLARSCSIDIHPKVFLPGCCARTLFAEVPALVMTAAAPGAFQILADASFDGHLQTWFANALQDDFK